MKVFYKNARTLSSILSLLFLLQGCYVHHRVPISLDEAVAADRRMKVTTIDNKKYKFKKIEKTDSIYYGVAKVKDQQEKVQLQKAKILSIHAVDKDGSTLITIGVFVLPIAILYAIGYSIRDELVELPSY